MTLANSVKWLESGDIQNYSNKSEVTSCGHKTGLTKPHLARSRMDWVCRRKTFWYNIIPGEVFSSKPLCLFVPSEDTVAISSVGVHIAHIVDTQREVL